MPTTPPATQAALLLGAVENLRNHGLKTSAGAFADWDTGAQDVPAAIYRSTNGGFLPLVFALPEAAGNCKAIIAESVTAMDTIATLAAHVNALNDAPASPEAQAAAADDPIDFLAYWPDRPGEDIETVITVMTGLAHQLNAQTATAA